MDALVITMREGIEAALVIGIVLAFVRKTGRGDLGRWIIGGTVAAAVFSIVIAVGLGLSGIQADDPAVEGALYLVAAAAVVSMVVWMWRNGREVHGQVQSRVRSILESEGSTRRMGMGLFLLAFFMVAREGVEAVLFISASALGTARSGSALLGAVAGLGLAVLYGVLFAKGSIKIDMRLFFRLTSVVLVLLAVKLAGGSIHEFEEAGILAMSQTMAHFFDLFAGSPIVDWLFVVALLVPLAAPFAQRIRPRECAEGC